MTAGVQLKLTLHAHLLAHRKQQTEKMPHLLFLSLPLYPSFSENKDSIPTTQNIRRVYASCMEDANYLVHPEQQNTLYGKRSHCCHFVIACEIVNLF